MQFDIKVFIEQVLQKAASTQEAVQMVYDEIRKAENQKVGFLDQASENPDFYNLLGSQVDSYITYLKVLHNQMAPQGPVALDEQIYRTDKAVIDSTMKLVKQLEQLEKNKLGANYNIPQKSNLNNTAPDS